MSQTGAKKKKSYQRSIMEGMYSSLAWFLAWFIIYISFQLNQQHQQLWGLQLEVVRSVMCLVSQGFTELYTCLQCLACNKNQFNDFPLKTVKKNRTKKTRKKFCFLFMCGFRICTPSEPNTCPVFTRSFFFFCNPRILNARKIQKHLVSASVKRLFSAVAVTHKPSFVDQGAPCRMTLLRWHIYRAAIPRTNRE